LLHPTGAVRTWSHVGDFTRERALACIYDGVHYRTSPRWAEDRGARGADIPHDDSLSSSSTGLTRETAFPPARPRVGSRDRRTPGSYDWVTCSRQRPTALRETPRWAVASLFCYGSCPDIVNR
jgi:hypothetical protein